MNLASGGHGEHLTYTVYTDAVVPGPTVHHEPGVRGHGEHLGPQLEARIKGTRQALALSLRMGHTFHIVFQAIPVLIVKKLCLNRFRTDNNSNVL